jgi:hypothetical protein
LADAELLGRVALGKWIRGSISSPLGDVVGGSLALGDFGAFGNILPFATVASPPLPDRRLDRRRAAQEIN